MSERPMTSLMRTRSGVPDPTILLFLLAGMLVAGALATDPMVQLALIGAALLPVLVWLFLRLTSSPEAGITLLVVAAAMPRGAVEVGGLNARPEHVAVGLLCLALPLLLRRHPQRPQWLYADLLLAAYIATNLVSSVFMSPEPPQTLKWSLQQMLAILPYFLLRLTASNERGFRWAFRVFLLVGALEGAYGLVAYYSNFLFSTTFGVEVEQYVTMPATYGTQFEANLLGAYCGATAVALLAMYVQEKKNIYLVGYAVTLAGMLVSLSRAALATVVMGVVVLGYYARKRGLIDRRAVAAALLASACACLVCAPMFSRYAQRLSELDISEPSSDEGTLYRLVQSAAAIDDIIDSPILGNGTASFQLLFDQTAAPINVGVENPWIGNTELRVMHDTGAVGLTFFLLFLVLLLRKALPLMRSGTHPAMLALMSSGAVYCGSFQFTEGTLLAFAWIHLGLIACLVAMAEARRKEGVEAGSDWRRAASEAGGP